MCASYAGHFGMVPHFGTSNCAAGANLSRGMKVITTAQRIFISGQLDVISLPENYKKITSELSWTLMNFRLPWNKVSFEKFKVRPSQAMVLLSQITCFSSQHLRFTRRALQC